MDSKVKKNIGKHPLARAFFEKHPDMSIADAVKYLDGEIGKLDAEIKELRK